METGCGGRDFFLAVAVGPAVFSGAVVDGEAAGDPAAELGDEGCGDGAVVAGSPVLQATKMTTAGSTRSAFTQPVFQRTVASRDRASPDRQYPVKPCNLKLNLLSLERPQGRQ